MSASNRVRARKLFTLHPEVIEELRRLAEAENSSMSRKLERLITANYRSARAEIEPTPDLSNND